MTHMVKTYWKVFQLYYRKYFARTTGWFMLSLMEIPLYIMLVLRFQELLDGVDPIRNGLWVIGLALVGYAIILIAQINIFRVALIVPTCDMQAGILRHFLRIPPCKKEKISSGDLTNVLFSQTSGGEFLQMFCEAARNLVRAMGLCYIIAQVSWVLAVVPTFPVLFLILIPRMFGKEFVTAHSNFSAVNSKFETVISDTLNGILTVKLFNAIAFHVKLIRKLARRANEMWLKTYFLEWGVNAFAVGSTRLVIPIFLVLGGYLGLQGRVSAGELMLLYLLVTLVNESLMSAGFSLGYSLSYGGQLKNILGFLDHETEGEKSFPFERGQMNMNKVNFSYCNEKPILKEFSMTIQPGEKVAIVGSSGSGKSTIYDLLRGMQFPKSGQVRVDGVSVNDDNAPSLRKQIASVSQSAYLFDDDLTFNLTFGQERSRVEIDNVLRTVGLEEFVAGLPERMSTRFGPNGFAISGGEKARVCLARALLMDRPVLLLDEVTANIDSIREEEIMKKVLHRMDDKSVVVISHRLSTVKNFPRIVFLEKGQICGEGTHQELLSTCLRYKEMFGEQVG